MGVPEYAESFEVVYLASLGYFSMHIEFRSKKSLKSWKQILPILIPFQEGTPAGYVLSENRVF